jgi:hypothetical protein
MSDVGDRNRGLQRVVKTLERQEAVERNTVRTLETHRDRLTQAMDEIDRELAAREDRLEQTSVAMLAVSRNAAFRASDHRQNLARSLDDFDATRYEPARERVREVAVRRRSIEALATRRARAEADRLARSEQQRMDEAGTRAWFRKREI